MAITLMTTTGTLSDVQQALGVMPEVTSPTEGDGGPTRLSVEALPVEPVEQALPLEPQTPTDSSSSPDAVVVAPSVAVVETAPEIEAPDSEFDEDGEPTTERAARSSRTKLQTIKKLRIRAREAELRAARAEGELEVRRTLQTPAPVQTFPETSAPSPVAAPPHEANYDTYEAYIDAKATFQAKQAVAEALAEERTRVAAERQRDAQMQAQTVLRQRTDAFKTLHADYDEVIQNPNLPITQAMADVLTDPDNELGPAMAYALGKDPIRCQTIANMPPHRALTALGRLEAELSATVASPPPSAPPVTKTPTAPPPPTPVRGGAVSATISLEELAKRITVGDLNTSEWLRRRNEDVARRAQR